ncbi:MAG: glycosyltransferase family 1 protein, partial [Nitrososphaeria archaeon]
KGTGITRYSIDLFNNLKRHNEDVIFFQLFHPIELEGINNIKFLNLNSKYNDLGKPFSKFFVKNLKPVLKSDIIHISDPSIYGIHKIVQDAILTVHDLYYLDHNSNSILYSIYMRNAYKNIKRFKYIISNSIYTKNELINKLKINSNNVNVIYPYVDLDKFNYNKNKDKKSIGFSDDDIVILNVAYDSPNKNLRFLYELISKLPYRYKLVRIGKNNRANLEYAKKIGVINRIKFIENASDKELISFYHNSDVFVYPTSFEGFGYGNVEAMASGIPVISSNLDVIKEILDNAAILANPFDLSEYVDALVRLQDKDIYKEYSLKGLERAKVFSSEEQFRKLNEYYNAHF